MKLAVFPVTHPLYILEAVVTVQVPRLPTAFEKMVLRLVDASAEPALSAVTLRGAFEGMLGIPDAASLLLPRIHELTGLGMLKAPPGDSPLDAPLSTWRWTDTGRAFWRRGRLPGRSRPETIRYVFDPFSDRLAALAPGALPPGLAAPAPVSLPEDFHGVDLGPRIAASVPAEKHVWWRAGTEVMGVTTAFLETRWRKVELQVDCATDGILTVTAPKDNAFAQWLRDAQQELIWDSLLAPSICGGIEVPEAGRLDLGRAIDATPASGLATASDQQVEGAMLLVVPEDYQPETTRSDLVVLTSTDPQTSVCAELAAKESASAGSQPLAACVAVRTELPSTLRRIEVRAPQGAPRAVLEGAATVLLGGPRAPRRPATCHGARSESALLGADSPRYGAMASFARASSRPGARLVVPSSGRCHGTVDAARRGDEGVRMVGGVGGDASRHSGPDGADLLNR